MKTHAEEFRHWVQAKDTFAKRCNGEENTSENKGKAMAAQVQ